MISLIIGTETIDVSDMTWFRITGMLENLVDCKKSFTLNYEKESEVEK